MGWVEYCNSSANTHYANLRRQNGRDKPYNVCPSRLRSILSITQHQRVP